MVGVPQGRMGAQVDSPCPPCPVHQMHLRREYPHRSHTWLAMAQHAHKACHWRCGHQPPRPTHPSLCGCCIPPCKGYHTVLTIVTTPCRHKGLLKPQDCSALQSRKASAAHLSPLGTKGDGHNVLARWALGRSNAGQRAGMLCTWLNGGKATVGEGGRWPASTPTHG